MTYFLFFFFFFFSFFFILSYEIPFLKSFFFFERISQNYLYMYNRWKEKRFNIGAIFCLIYKTTKKKMNLKMRDYSQKFIFTDIV